MRYLPPSPVAQHPILWRRRSFLIYLFCYILAITLYLLVAIPAEQAVIKNSPTVYVTRAGAKYHEAYHYHGRNRPISLYEAVDRNYDACLVCRPVPASSIQMPPWYYRRWLALPIAFTVISYFAGAWIFKWKLPT